MKSERSEYRDADDMKDVLWGPVGTPERDAMEAELKKEVQAYMVGEAIRENRKRLNLSQTELGDRVGVKKSQISKLEHGRGIIQLPTICRVFQALGFPSAKLDLGNGESIPLW